MFSDSILSLFRLRVSGDEGSGDSGNQNSDDQNNNNSNDGNGGDQGSGNNDDQGNDGKFEISDLPQGAQKLIKDLRAENAKHRTSNNNLSTEMEKFKTGLKGLFGEGDDDVDPAKQLETVTGNYESAVTRNAILELAVENGISGKENLEYFEFLMNKSLSSLKEGEEMTEETLAEIVAQSVPTKGPANTSTKNDGDNDNGGADDKDDEVTQEEFNKMGMTQKSLLYRQKPELYKKLLAGAKL